MNDNPETRSLVEKYLEGTLEPNEADKLASLVETDEETRKLMHENVLIHFLLRQRCFMSSDPEAMYKAESSSDDYEALLKPLSREDWVQLLRYEKSAIPVPKAIPDAVPRKWYHVFYTYRISLSLISLALLIGFVVWISWTILQNGPVTSPERVISPEQPLARIIETIDAVWENNSFSYKLGQRIDVQTPLSLQSGLVQLEMNNGTKLILEGPTELSICNAMNAFCQSGKVSVRVPPNASGYELTTPFGSIIDRGTEFFVEVGKNETHTDVMEGKVEICRVNMPTIHLPEGKRFSYELNQKEKIVPLQKTRGISCKVFDTLVFRYYEKILADKIASTQEQDKSPNLLARFNGKDRTKSVIPNAAHHGMTLCPELQLFNCSKGPGSIEGLESIRFERSRSSAEFSLPGKYDSMTLCVLFRLSQLSEQGEIIMASNRFLKEAGTGQWKILETGEVCLFLTTPEQKQISFRSKPVIFNRDCETWIHLAVVMDKERKTITHYLDGKPIQTSKWTNPFPIALGSTTLGTMKSERLILSNRCFNGSMEEVQIWNKALTPDEIGELVR